MRKGSRDFPHYPRLSDRTAHSLQIQGGSTQPCSSISRPVATPCRPTTPRGRPAWRWVELYDADAAAGDATGPRLINLSNRGYVGVGAVILDLDMPGISGHEFARRARSAGYLTPVLVVSGRITEADRHVLSELKVDVFVHKPFEPAELLAALEKALAAPTALA